MIFYTKYNNELIKNPPPEPPGGAVTKPPLVSLPPPDDHVVFQDGVSLLPGDAGELQEQQQEPRVPGSHRQGPLGGLELRRPETRVRLLRQDSECVPPGEGPSGERQLAC